MPKSAKKRTKMENLSSEDEEDALEMERNFALLSKRSMMQTSAEDGEETRDDVGSAEDDEKAEEDDEAPEEDDEEAEEDDGAPEEDDEEAEEDDEGPEEADDNGMDDEGDSGSDEEESGSDEEESDSDHEDGGSKAQSHRGGDIKSELSTMSFEEIIKLQNRVGTKVYNKIAYGDTKQKQQKNEPMKRLNKHRPQEISAKKHVPFLRKVVPVKKRISRDPRFDDLSGEYKPEIFNQTYKFINELREKETQIVKKNLKKVKSKTKKQELKALLKRMENQERERQRKEQEREKELQFKRKQRELVGQGHKPFYLKKSDMKKLELAEKYSELKKSGKLENFLSKKRKRNATKDRKHLPKMR